MKRLLGIVLIVLISLVATFGQQMISGVMYQSMAWSPDERYIALTRMEIDPGKAQKMSADIYVVRADGTDLKKITGDDRNDFEPAWSKDGKKIFFCGVTVDRKNAQIFSVNRDGTDLKQVTNEVEYSSSPVVSRDGKTIVFNTQSGENKHQIAVMNVDGSNRKALTNDPTVHFYNPQLSAKVKRLSFMSSGATTRIRYG